MTGMKNDERIIPIEYISGREERNETDLRAE